MKPHRLLYLVLFFIISACNPDPAVNEQKEQRAKPSKPEFTEFQLEHGIGPVTDIIELGPIDQQLVEKGRVSFNMKCASCHLMDDRFVGPPLGDVLDRRSPAFIMNMILNPTAMAREHPEGRKMLAEYMTPMPFQNVTEEEARALLEYLRTVSK